MKVQNREPKVPLQGDLGGKSQNRELLVPLKSLSQTSFGRDLGRKSLLLSLRLPVHKRVPSTVVCVPTDHFLFFLFRLGLCPHRPKPIFRSDLEGNN